MLIIKQHRIYRIDLRANPQLLYLFGDNLERRGMNGQAREMRGEPNAFGIATKRRMAHDGDYCYFHDGEGDAVNSVIDDFDKLASIMNLYRAIVIPSDGIGTGLAELPKRAPGLLKFIETKLKRLE